MQALILPVRRSSSRRPLIAPADAPSTRLAPGELRGYRPAWLRGDISAGLAIAAVGLPSADRLSGDRRPAAGDRPLRQHRAARRLRALRTVAAADRRARRRDDDRAGRRARAAVPGLAAADRAGVAAMLALVVGGLCLGGAGARPRRARRPSCRGRSSSASSPASRSRSSSARSAASPASPIDADGLIAPFVELARKAALHPLALARARGSRCSPCCRPCRAAAASGARARSSSSSSRSAFRPLFDFRGHGIAVVGDIPTRPAALRHPRAPAALPLDQHPPRRRARSSSVSFGAGIVTARSFGAARRLPGRRRPRADRLRRRQPRRRPLRRLPGHRLGLAHRDQRSTSAAARSSPASSPPRRWSRRCSFCEPRCASCRSRRSAPSWSPPRSA